MTPFPRSGRWWPVLAAALVLCAGCGPETGAGPEHGPEAGQHGEDPPQGPRGGRLLEDGRFGLEVRIAEAGEPPRFELYPYLDGAPLEPAAVDVELTVTRLDGQSTRFGFAPSGAALRADGIVGEPHSFAVAVVARHAGAEYRWTFDSVEGRTTIPAATAALSGIQVAEAGPATLTQTIQLTGTVQAVPSGMAEVRARFPGVVRAIRRDVGDVVSAGDVLAVVENNESLRTFEVTAPIGGTVVERLAQVGQVTTGEPLLRIVNLERVWVQLDVFGNDIGTVETGQPVVIETLDGYSVAGEIAWLSPLVAHGSQSLGARVPLANPAGRLRPGQFVRAEVTVARFEVPLAVELAALQAFRDWQVVFEKIGDSYEVRMLELGRRDARHVEVLGGLRPGAVYVVGNSYLVKADIEKSGASHDH